MVKQKRVIRTKRIYRKRSGHKRVFGTVLFVLLLVALVGFGYIVMKEWSKRFGSGAPQPSAPSSDLASLPPSEPTSSETSSEPSTVLGAVHAKLMPSADLTRTGAALTEYMQELRSAGYDAVYIELKSADGTVTFNTANGMAKQVGAVGEAPADLDALIAAAKAAGLTPIARISALQDSKAAHVKYGNSFGYENSAEVNWLDDSPSNGGKAWLNPYMENARKYIADLCAEAAQHGFDTIVLENVNFPLKNTGKMGTLNETVTRDAILAQLVSECRTAAGGAKILNAPDVGILTTQSQAASYQTVAAQLCDAPVIRLDSLSKYKQSLCQKTGLTAEGTDKSAITTADLAKAILTQTLAAGESGSLTVLATEQDLATLQPILNELKITSTIIL